MSISTYADLKTAIANWARRSDLTDIIPDLIALAESRIWRSLRTREMEESFSSAISSGTVAVPTGYLEMKRVSLAGAPARQLKRRPADWIIENYPTRSADSRPAFFAIEDGYLIFGPYPDSAYTVEGVYYKRPDALSASNTTNWLLTNHPNVLLFGALAELEPYVVNDERIAIWERKFGAALADAQLANDHEAFSGSTVQVM